MKIGIKRCTEGYGRWIMDSIKAMSGGLVSEYQFTASGNDVTSWIYFK